MSFDALFNEMYPPLHRYLLRLTGDADAADDAAQEAFVRLARAEIPEQGAKGWLFTVATNLVRDGARSSKRRERLLAATPFAPARPSLPDEDLERAETIRTVRAALQLLAPRDRQLLLMREEGFRYDEIARAVGVAPGSVGTLVARAAKRFAAAYAAREEER
ncbi:MAG: sigma-70 family RNA polymerase sigma factor [Gemmatimonadota bacterium]|nr:sigma-70 family RNA polymerase sigma factor [Gemmatimonadota bacterium]